MLLGGHKAHIKQMAQTLERESELGAANAERMRELVRLYGDDAVFDALRQHFSTTEIVELTSAIATYNMVARFLVALGVTPEH